MTRGFGRDTAHPFHHDYGGDHDEMTSPHTGARRYYAPTEQLTRPELEEYQLRKLRRLLEYNYESNDFYRDRWKKAKVAPDDIKTLADFRHKVPHIQKQDCLEDQTATPPFGRRLGVPKDKVRQVHLTSGTSGIGQEAWGLTQADVELTATLWMKQYHWMGLEKGDVALYSMPVAFFANGLSADYAGRKMGMIAFNLFGLDRELVFGVMDRFQPQYVYGTLAMPSFSGSDSGPPPRERFPHIKALSGAMMSASSLRTVSEAWGAPVYEMYGCTQGSSVVAATCEETTLVGESAGIVHFLEDHFLVECLNRETGEPSEPGEDCEIFLTTLDREASPAIRFRMHDKAEFMTHDQCACGRPFHGYRAGSIGRWDDMMKIKGINVWPSTMDELVMAHPEVREYRGFAEMDDARSREVMRIVVDFKKDLGLSPADRTRLLAELAAEVKAKTFVTPHLEESADEMEQFLFKPARWTDRRKHR